MKTLYFIFYIIDHSVCNQSPPYLKYKYEKKFATYWEKCFLNSYPLFLD